MIKFSCKGCGQKLNAEEKYSGKRMKCPKCGTVGIVPDDSEKIKFHCESCGQSISVPQIHAGKKGKCPKCKNAVVVPSAAREPAGSAASGRSTPSAANENLYQDETDLPEEEEGQNRRLIFTISGAAAVVVVGLIILVTVVLPSRSRRIEEPEAPPRQEATVVDSRENPAASESLPTATPAPGPVKEDVAPIEPATSLAGSDGAGKLDLKLRLEPGQKRHLRIVREVHSSQTIEGQPTDENLTNAVGLEFEVENVDTNGVTSLKVTYLTIREMTRTADGQMEYDSTKPDMATNHPARLFFSAMIGQSFVAKVTPEGEIVELEGLDEMYRQMAEPIVKYSEEKLRQMAKSRGLKVVPSPREKRIESRMKGLEMHSHTGRNAIREMLSSVIMPFPRGPVGTGDSWQARTILSSEAFGDIGLYGCTYNLREAKQAAVFVDISSNIRLDNEVLYGREGGPDSPRVTLTGSCEGSLEIEPSTGWMLHKNMTLRYSGEVKTAPTEQAPQGTTMTMSREILTTVE